jgi:hypothetical protein
MDSHDDASDHTPENMKFMRNRGHGTGTLSLRASNKLDGKLSGWASFTGLSAVT